MIQRHVGVSILILYASILCAYAQSPDLKFKLIEDPSGKPLGKIRNIVQDPSGAMWFSGEGAKCIYRFDGSKLITYVHDEANPNSLGGTNINSIYADERGLIWVGMGNGLDQFNPVTGIFKHYRHDDNDPGSLSKGAVIPIIRDHLGRLWVGGDGLNQLDEKTNKFIHYRHDPGNSHSISSNVIWNLYEDHQGTLWIACGKPFINVGKDWEDGGLNRLERDGSFSQYKHSEDPHSLISNKVRAMYEDSHGNFWVGTSGDGLHTMDRKTGRFERHTYDTAHPDKLSRPPLKKEDKFIFENDQVTFIQEDAMGSIWIGTMWSGLNRYDTLTKKITHFEKSNGFADASGWNAYQSRDGMLWISTQEDHLYRVDPYRINLNKVTTGLPVSRLLSDNGQLWAATAEGGLLQYDSNKNLVRHYKHNSANTSSISNDIVNALFKNQTDTLWVGTQAGVDLLNKNTGEFSKFPLPFAEKQKARINKTMNIIQSKDMMWFTTWGNGLIRYNRKDHSFKHILIDEKDVDELSANHLDPMLVDSIGNLWIGSMKGILYYNTATGTFKRYREDLKIPYVFKDSRGILWAGTSKGLYSYNQREDAFVAFFDSQTRLSNERVYGIIEDKLKNLWLSTPIGIVRINGTRDDTFIYGEQWGISDFQPFIGSITSTTTGDILIGYENTFYEFDPKKLDMKNNFHINISSFAINRVDVVPGTGSAIAKPINETRSIHLKYDENNFSFNFSTDNYRAPESTRYFTMMEGYDTWREVLGEKRSDYFFVPAGTYTYHLRAYNHDGTRAEKKITIIISPPWWRTWWAYATYGVLALGVSFTVYQQQMQRVIARETQKAQLKELDQAKQIQTAYDELKATQSLLIQSEKMASLGELTAGIAHEIQNPLNFVNNFSEINTELLDELQLALTSGNSDEAFSLVKDIRDNEHKINLHGKRADGIVKGMLQHGRVSNGVKAPTEINKLTDEYLRLAYHGLRAKDKTFNATMKTDFDESIGTIEAIPQDIGRVILNLFTNSFYSVAEKKRKQGNVFEPIVSVSTRRINSVIEIKVRDNGVGISNSVKEKIFQPFFTTKPAGQGTGLGLSLSYDIVKAHNGTLKLETQEGEFAEFIIQLPVK